MPEVVHLFHKEYFVCRRPPRGNNDSVRKIIIESVNRRGYGNAGSIRNREIKGDIDDPCGQRNLQRDFVKFRHNPTRAARIDRIRDCAGRPIDQIAGRIE